MSVVELLRSYGAAFWKTAVEVEQDEESVRFSHPGFFEAVNVSFDMMRGFNDVDAAGLMSCKPTGRNGYVSCFRREVLVRAGGDPFTEEVLRSGEAAEVLADVIDGELRYRLGPASTVLQLVFSHLYPIDRVDFSKEYAIRIEPAYTESIQDDDLTRRLSQMKAATRLEQMRREGDAAIPRFLVELSSVLNLHLKVWDVPEALEYAYMAKKRRQAIEDPQRIAQVFAYEMGVDLYLRAIQVNEPNLRIFGLLQVIESHYLRYGYEGVLARLRERIGSRQFDVNDDSQLLEVIAEASSVRTWRDDTIEILADILDQHVDRDELERVLGDLCEADVVTELCEPRSLSLFLHDLRDLVEGRGRGRHSPVFVDPQEIRSYVPLVQWLTVTIMRGHALDRALATASQPAL